MNQRIDRRADANRSMPFSCSQRFQPSSGRCVEILKSLRALKDGGAPVTWKTMAEIGVLGITMPAEYGGDALPLMDHVAVFEEMGYLGFEPGLLFSMSAQIWSVQQPLCKFGLDEQKSRYLPRLIDGGLRAAHAATEPHGGSDVFGLTTGAERCPGGYSINGKKRFITGAPSADLILALATVDPARGIWGMTSFLIPGTAPGVKRSANIEKMGLRSAAFGEIEFDGCYVEAGCRLGAEGGGAAVFNYALDHERSLILSPIVGRMRRQLELAVDRATRGRPNQRRTGRHQSVSNRIADMQVRLELSRLLLRHAVDERTRGHAGRMLSSIVKLAISENFLASSQDALRVAGGEGYLDGDEAAVDVQDAFGAVLYSGTSDIQRNIISQCLGLTDG